MCWRESRIHIEILWPGYRESIGERDDQHHFDFGSLDQVVFQRLVISLRSSRYSLLFQMARLPHPNTVHVATAEPIPDHS